MCGKKTWHTESSAFCCSATHIRFILMPGPQHIPCGPLAYLQQLALKVKVEGHQLAERLGLPSLAYATASARYPFTLYRRFTRQLFERCNG